MKRRREIWLVLFALLVGRRGLSNSQMSINDSNPPVFSFRVGLMPECCDRLLFLSVSEVTDSNNSQEEKIIWQIWAHPGIDNSGNGLPLITYGRVPSGFVQKIPSDGPPPGLEEGKVYKAFGPPSQVAYARVTF